MTNFREDKPKLTTVFAVAATATVVTAAVAAAVAIPVVSVPAIVAAIGLHVAGAGLIAGTAAGATMGLKVGSNPIRALAAVSTIYDKIKYGKNSL